MWWQLAHEPFVDETCSSNFGKTYQKKHVIISKHKWGHMTKCQHVNLCTEVFDNHNLFLTLISDLCSSIASVLLYNVGIQELTLYVPHSIGVHGIPVLLVFDGSSQDTVYYEHNPDIPSLLDNNMHILMWLYSIQPIPSNSLGDSIYSGLYNKKQDIFIHTANAQKYKDVLQWTDTDIYKEKWRDNIISTVRNSLTDMHTRSVDVIQVTATVTKELVAAFNVFTLQEVNDNEEQIALQIEDITSTFEVCLKRLYSAIIAHEKKPPVYVKHTVQLYKDINHLVTKYIEPAYNKHKTFVSKCPMLGTQVTSQNYVELQKMFVRYVTGIWETANRLYVKARNISCGDMADVAHTINHPWMRALTTRFEHYMNNTSILNILYIMFQSMNDLKSASKNTIEYTYEQISDSVKDKGPVIKFLQDITTQLNKVYANAQVDINLYKIITGLDTANRLLTYIHAADKCKKNTAMSTQVPVVVTHETPKYWCTIANIRNFLERHKQYHEKFAKLKQSIASRTDVYTDASSNEIYSFNNVLQNIELFSTQEYTYCISVPDNTIERNGTAIEILLCQIEEALTKVYELYPNTDQIREMLIGKHSVIDIVKKCTNICMPKDYWALHTYVDQGLESALAQLAVTAFKLFLLPSDTQQQTNTAHYFHVQVLSSPIIDNADCVLDSEVNKETLKRLSEVWDISHKDLHIYFKYDNKYVEENDNGEYAQTADDIFRKARCTWATLASQTTQLKDNLCEAQETVWRNLCKLATEFSAVKTLNEIRGLCEAVIPAQRHQKYWWSIIDILAQNVTGSHESKYTNLANELSEKIPSVPQRKALDSLLSIWNIDVNFSSSVALYSQTKYSIVVDFMKWLVNHCKPVQNCLQQITQYMADNSKHKTKQWSDAMHNTCMLDEFPTDVVIEERDDMGSSIHTWTVAKANVNRADRGAVMFILHICALFGEQTLMKHFVELLMTNKCAEWLPCLPTGNPIAKGPAFDENVLFTPEEMSNKSVKQDITFKITCMYATILTFYMQNVAKKPFCKLLHEVANPYRSKLYFEKWTGAIPEMLSHINNYNQLYVEASHVKMVQPHSQTKVTVSDVCSVYETFRIHTMTSDDEDRLVRLAETAMQEQETEETSSHVPQTDVEGQTAIQIEQGPNIRTLKEADEMESNIKRLVQCYKTQYRSQTRVKMVSLAAVVELCSAHGENSFWENGFLITLGECAHTWGIHCGNVTFNKKGVGILQNTEQLVDVNAILSSVANKESLIQAYRKSKPLTCLFTSYGTKPSGVTCETYDIQLGMQALHTQNLANDISVTDKLLGESRHYVQDTHDLSIPISVQSRQQYSKDLDTFPVYSIALDDLTPSGSEQEFYSDTEDDTVTTDIHTLPIGDAYKSVVTPNLLEELAQTMSNVTLTDTRSSPRSSSPSLSADHTSESVATDEYEWENELMSPSHISRVNINANDFTYMVNIHTRLAKLFEDE